MLSSPVTEPHHGSNLKRPADDLGDDATAVRDNPKRCHLSSNEFPSASMIMEALERQSLRQAEHNAKIEHYMEKSDKNTSELINVLKEFIAIQGRHWLSQPELHPDHYA